MQVIRNPAARVHDVGCRRGPVPVRPSLVIENLTEFESHGSAPYCVTIADYECEHLA
jgi:hypothetical protein